MTNAWCRETINMFDQRQIHAIQASLFDVKPQKPSRIVNVSAVRQLSPFRYPGGKTWLVPTVRDWLQNRKMKPRELIEVFAGGGIIGLTVAHENLAESVTMIELDPDVASVWHTILSEDYEWLAKFILGFNLTSTNVNQVLENTARNTKERAFQTILKNRIFHGGILAPGSGLIKNGENGKGIASRWYPETLAKRIRHIQIFREKITFIEGDGIEYMEKSAEQPDVVFFIDPPYTAPGKQAGSRLYRYFQLDHAKLFDIANRIHGDFMMTYDDAKYVHDMATRYGFTISRVPMKGTHHKEVFELLLTAP